MRLCCIICAAVINGTQQILEVIQLMSSSLVALCVRVLRGLGNRSSLAQDPQPPRLGDLYQVMIQLMCALPQYVQKDSLRHGKCTTVHLHPVYCIHECNPGHCMQCPSAAAGDILAVLKLLGLVKLLMLVACDSVVNCVARCVRCGSCHHSSDCRCWPPAV